jgi:hypothetical protein
MYANSGSRTIRILRVQALLFALVIGTVAAAGGPQPAAAAPNTVYANPAHAGNARFAEYGDHVYLCDEDEDGHSVAVELSYVPDSAIGMTPRKEETRWNEHGPYTHGGCEDINLEVEEDSIIEYRVCLGDHAERGGKKAAIIKGSCGPWTSVYNDG